MNDYPPQTITGLPQIVLADLVAESKRAQRARIHRDEAQILVENAMTSTALGRYPEEDVLRAFRWSWKAARWGPSVPWDESP